MNLQNLSLDGQDRLIIENPQGIYRKFRLPIFQNGTSR